MNFLRPMAPQAPPAVLNPPVAVPSAPAYADSSLNQISLEYTYSELQHATRNFAESMKLGSGSYGGVYRGVLKDGTEVAIKVLDVPAEAGFEEEVKVLSKFRHPHLVILMGFARHGTQRLLVYEMLAGGDVHKRLQRSCIEGVSFLWHERVSIALDAACGLSHLHHSTPKVYHRDIKTPNILLDKNGTAKMADFGLACLSNASAHRVKQASGTVGYACPLYVQRGVVTEGSEVYSFGMVLLELLTASPPAYMSPTGGGAANGAAAGGGGQIQYLANHINGDLRTALSLIDSKAQWPPAAARAVTELALSCIRMREERRPNFGKLVRALRAINDGSLAAPSVSPPVPLRPAPCQAVSSMPPGAKARAGSPTSSSPVHTPALAPSPAAAPAPSAATAAASCSGQRRVSAASPARCFQNKVLGMPAAQGANASSFMAAPRIGRPHESTLQNPALIPSPKAKARPSNSMQPPLGMSPKAHRAYSPVAAPSLGVRSVPVEVHSGCAGPNPFCQPPTAAPAALGHQLFRLELIFSEGVALDNVSQDKRTIPYSLSVEERSKLFMHGATLPPLRVGRVFQAGIFDLLVVGTAARSTISREHFIVWAEKTCVKRQQLAPDEDETFDCVFYLENSSGNGTHINNRHLKGRGERAVLHHGDVITLSRSGVGVDGSTYQARFLQFRFDIPIDSCLSDSHADVDEEVQEDWDYDDEECSDSSCSDEAEDTLLAGGLPPGARLGNGSSRGPLSPGRQGAYRDGDVAFVLEVCGPAVRDQVPVEQRRIAYAPPPENEAEDSLEPRLFHSLIIGRAHQLDFWQQVLRSDAFNTLSRQHFEVQTWRSMCVGTGGIAASAALVAPFSFLVRNLSDVNPVHVRSGPEETAEEPPALLQRGEQRHLLDGDEIVLNIDQEHTFWLIFRDLTASTYVPSCSALEEQEDRCVSGHSVTQVDSSLMTMPLGGLGLAAAAEQARPSISSSLRPAPREGSTLMKDEDEISTTATPPLPGDLHDGELLHQDDEDEEDEEDATSAFVVPPGGGNGVAASAKGLPRAVPRVVPRVGQVRGIADGASLALRCSLAGPPVPRNDLTVRGCADTGRDVRLRAFTTPAPSEASNAAAASFATAAPSPGRAASAVEAPGVATSGIERQQRAPSPASRIAASPVPQVSTTGYHGSNLIAATAAAGPWRHTWVAPEVFPSRGMSPTRR